MCKIIDEAAVTNPLKITGEPEDFTGKVGDTAVFTVVAENAASYQWQYSMDDGENWTNLSTRTETLNFGITKASRMKYVFKCIVTGEDETTKETRVCKIIEAVATNTITIASVSYGEPGQQPNGGPDGLLITYDVNTVEENTKVRLLVSNDGTFNDEWYPQDKNTSEVNGVPTQYVFAPGLKLYLKAQLLDQNGNVLATQTTATEAEPRPFNEESPYNKDGHVLDFNNKGVAFVQVRGPFPPYYVVKVSATGTYSLATRGTGQPGIHNAKGQKLEITNGSFVITDNDVGNLFIQAFDIGEFSLTAPGYYTDADNALTYAVNGTAQTVSVTSFHAPNATTVYVPAEVSVNGQNYQVTAIGPEAFMDNTVITTAALPNSITVIGARAFKGCTSLSQMTSHD